MVDSIVFFPVEVMSKNSQPDILKKLLKKDADQ